MWASTPLMMAQKRLKILCWASMITVIEIASRPDEHLHRHGCLLYLTLTAVLLFGELAGTGACSLCLVQ